MKTMKKVKKKILKEVDLGREVKNKDIKPMMHESIGENKIKGRNQRQN